MTRGLARVLVIDDDRAIRSLVALILGKAGLQVVEAKSGEEGLQYFPTTPIDVVITDILMPGQDGLSVIRELHARFPKLKIIAFSGGGMVLSAEDNLALAMKAGALQSLTKPFTRQELLKTVSRVLRKPLPCNTTRGRSCAEAP